MVLLYNCKLFPLLLQYLQIRTKLKSHESPNHWIVKKTYRLYHIGKKEEKKAKTRPEVDSNPCSTGPEESTLPSGPFLFVVIICRLRETDIQIHDNRQQQQLLQYVQNRTIPKSHKSTKHWNEKKTYFYGSIGKKEAKGNKKRTLDSR